ncbi:6-carboxytetrahydropterin synthase [Methanocaldococcus vulcanius]|nr:6-carboxytetrahydropterin synthase [Methanocaldococcus vulcanius]
MMLELNGLHAGLRFSSAHIVFGHPSCGVIHGHSYYVDVRIFGERCGEFNFVCDFKTIKTVVKEICEKLDHKLILPKNHEKVYYELKDKTLYFKYKYKEYTIPVEDVILLPIPSTTAEDLAKYFTNEISKKLKNLGFSNIIWIEVSINEGIGQGACYRKYLKEYTEER